MSCCVAILVQLNYSRWMELYFVESKLSEIFFFLRNLKNVVSTRAVVKTIEMRENHLLLKGAKMRDRKKKKEMAG